MAICNGRGSDGDHCCYIEGQVCIFLEDRPRNKRPLCMLWDDEMIGNPLWENAPIGQFMMSTYPGFDCRDWPQNIPNVTGGLCCWGDVA